MKRVKIVLLPVVGAGSGVTGPKVEEGRKRTLRGRLFWSLSCDSIRRA